MKFGASDSPMAFRPMVINLVEQDQVEPKYSSGLV